LVEIGERVLTDESLDPARVNAAAHAFAKAEAMMGPKTKVEVTGANNGPIQVKDVSARDILAAKIAAISMRLVEDASSE
jgi:hypothetical protein